ncbi:MAG TPA: alanine dehydrogenase [Candidatus Pacearchaeota archaeon]|nr:alanine dehydrogenase [Candidatus Pacearchaeota archaeon]HOU45675.1 alanine dehydrogenase [Candidatus Pacearchaeota archaeon]HQI74604.1 alanine dehydrogenase [Candidatus Pacearchaeota archaeon]
MIVLNQKEVQKIIPPKEAKKVVVAVEKAFGDYGLQKVQMPPKMYLYFKKENGDLRIMPSYSETLKMAGTKIVNVHPDNPKKGLKTVMASIILNDPKNGMPIALMDGTYITAIRTGAAGAVATKYLARQNAKTLGIVGAGEQAFTQIVCINTIKKMKEIYVYDLNPARIKALASRLNKEGIKIIAAESLKQAVQQDVVVTTTPSRKPIIKREWILPGTHINAIGADAEGKEELDPQILKDAKIVIDDWAQASHSGEINVPVHEGLIKESDVHGGLGDIVAKKIAGRANDQEITVFDSTGLGVQDLYTAALVYKMALLKKIGKKIEII